MGDEVEFFLQSNVKNKLACDAHIHNAVELIYVNEGSYTVTLDDVCYEIIEGDLVLFCSEAVHYIVTGESECNSYYVIKIPPSFFIGMATNDAAVEYAMRFAFNRKENKCLWHRDELEKNKMKNVLDELINEYEDEKYASEIAIKLKIMELLLAILRDDAFELIPANYQIYRLIYSVMCYIQEKYAEDIDEKELAKGCGMSYSYFSRSFKRITGMTFKNYLNRTRIGKAEQFILQNGGSISEAASACGYNSISYFISVYRAIMGKTPYKSLVTK